MSDAEPALLDPTDPETRFGDWMNQQMAASGVSISQLAQRSGFSYTTIRGLVRGTIRSPRADTRRRIAAALQAQVPDKIEEEAKKLASEIEGFEWSGFDPHDIESIPDKSGVYVLYDITDRPIYVGQSGVNVRNRIKDHQTRFWFKAPLVHRGSMLQINDPAMCLNIEKVLIKFLGRNALMNVKDVDRD